MGTPIKPSRDNKKLGAAKGISAILGVKPLIRESSPNPQKEIVPRPKEDVINISAQATPSVEQPEESQEVKKGYHIRMNTNLYGDLALMAQYKGVKIAELIDKYVRAGVKKDIQDVKVPTFSIEQ